MDEYYERMIALLKEQISFGTVAGDKASAFLRELGKEIDRRKVYNEPCAGLEKLYNDALWLKYSIS